MQAHDHSATTPEHRTSVSGGAKRDVLRRLAYVEGHLKAVRRMVEEEQYCVDVLKQTYAVRRAIEKLEAIILEGHLQGCVVEGIREGREDAVVGELLDLYELAGR
jgi:DNA-binding FrmR family transcriptional regulator